MHSEDGKWTYSMNDEIFNSGEFFDTKEKAIKAGKTDYTWEGICPTFYVGQVKSVNYAISVDVDGILDNVAQSVYDEVGEVADDYLDYVEKEHRQILESEMNEVLQKWMKKYGYEPTFFTVINIERVDTLAGSEV